MEYKRLFFDVETTGLDPNKNGIIQFSGIYEYQGNEKIIDLKMKPFPEDEIEEEALAVNNITKEELDAYMEPKKAYKKLVEWLDSLVDKYDTTDKIYLIGYNSHSFDIPFLRKFFLKNGNKYFGSYFWHPDIDVMLLASYAAIGQRHVLHNFKLGNVARSLGCITDESQLHDALYDAKLTKYIFELLDKELRRD